LARRPSRLRRRLARARSRPGRSVAMRADEAICWTVVVTSFRRSARSSETSSRLNWRLLSDPPTWRAVSWTLALLKALVMSMTSGAASPKVSGFCLAIRSER
jgi:hypothetical protein